MNKHTKILATALVAVQPGVPAASVFPEFDVRFEEARASVEDGQLVVKTGAVERRWELVDAGLATVSIRDSRSGKAWASGSEGLGADWKHPGFFGEKPAARLTGLAARESDDSGFTSPHLEVVVAFLYPKSGLELEYRISVYPGAEGIRTQVWLKGKPTETAVPGGAWQVDFVPASTDSRRAVGYYNDTQHRHEPDLHLVRDEVVPPGEIDWANVLFVEDARGGVAVVKESHKCVNQPGVDTGAFVADDKGVAVKGWGVSPADIAPGKWCWAWATWTVLYAIPTADARELALKRFDRVRYPVRADLDLYIKANTWGSGATGGESVRRAHEDEVLAEIDSVADLGLETLQIDDGWQVGRMDGEQPKEREWYPRQDWYPEGWDRVVARARDRGVDLGIWAAARAPLEALKWNHDHGGFKTWKLDFARLDDYEGIFSYLEKGRELIDYTNHSVRVNWDVTENAARFGYFWARECGNVWLANRKPVFPPNVVPKPWLMLREVWELSRYLNTNKFELPVQNFRIVNQDASDANLHSDTYAVALGLPGIPVFFQTTRLLEEDQRAEIKALLRVYRAARDELFSAFVFPIGDEPDNESWAGFQWTDSENASAGHVLVFRERLNRQAERQIPLRFMPPESTLHFFDLRTGNSFDTLTDSDGAVILEIDQPGDVFFARYSVR